ncbi:hypothetical protein C8F01DRAFT_1343904 [Mycena amicta]|nr:hypothetical protein C8F01DRAFT_1343904 [Mycena amicta]
MYPLSYLHWLDGGFGALTRPNGVAIRGRARASVDRSDSLRHLWCDYCCGERVWMDRMLGRDEHAQVVGQSRHWYRRCPDTQIDARRLGCVLVARGMLIFESESIGGEHGYVAGVSNFVAEDELEEQECLTEIHEINRWDSLAKLYAPRFGRPGVRNLDLTCCELNLELITRIKTSQHRAPPSRGSPGGSEVWEPGYWPSEEDEEEVEKDGCCGVVDSRALAGCMKMRDAGLQAARRMTTMMVPSKSRR